MKHLNDEQLVQLIYDSSSSQSPADQSDWLSHLSNCPTCQGRLKQLERLGECLDEFSVEPQPLALNWNRVLAGPEELNDELEANVNSFPTKEPANIEFNARGNIAKADPTNTLSCGWMIAPVLIASAIGFLAGDFFRTQRLNSQITQTVEASLAEHHRQTPADTEQRMRALENQITLVSESVSTEQSKALDPSFKQETFVWLKELTDEHQRLGKELQALATNTDQAIREGRRFDMRNAELLDRLFETVGLPSAGE